MKTWQMAVVGLLVAAAAGFSIFFAMAWRAVDLEHAAAHEALRQFDEARAAFGETQPLLQVSGTGLTRRPVPEATGPPPEPAETLKVLAYRVSEAELARAEVPLWFLDLKEPAIRVALRGTGLQPGELGLTAEELKRLGPRLLMDVARSNGDRVLVWTQ